MNSSPFPRTIFGVLTLATLTALGPTVGPLSAQGLKLAAGDVGLGIGDVPRLDGLRLNFRDGELQRVRGINATLWDPYSDAYGGSVRGIALGLPLTGARDIEGVAIGVGVSADRDLSGIGVGVLGMGSGGELSGIMVGGLGMGAGDGMSGIMIGGLGAGSGGDVSGILLGGVGAGASGHVRGFMLGGVGGGAGQGLSGIGIGGIGVGTGGDAKGLLIGGLGVGAEGDITGVAIGGVGVGAGGEIKGLAIGGMGVGARAMTGVSIGLGFGAQDINALILAPAYFKAIEDGTMRGVSVSAFNRTMGRQNGLTIGILNIADELHGVQVGLINIAKNKARYRVMPFVNWN
jgi:hypothetical protein